MLKPIRTQARGHKFALEKSLENAKYRKQALRLLKEGNCGVTRNEHVDKLARQALNTLLYELVQVPIEYADAKRRVETSPGSNRLMERVSEHQQVSTRKAEVILAQCSPVRTPNYIQWPHI